MRSIFALAVLCSTGCATFSIRADRCPAYPAPAAAPAEASVKVHYLGAGGYLVQRGSDVVLLGPQYSNPSLLEVALDQEIRTDRALVDRMLPADASRAAAIVIGHSHYDHLLDTPYIANAHAKGAKVYGSATMKNLIGSAVDPARLVDVGPEAVTNSSVAVNSRVRLWPIRSHHSDQMRLQPPLTGVSLPVHLWRGEVSTPQSTLPKSASGWAEGEVYAFLLDFLNEAGEVEFRVYYQDVGTDRPIGYPWGGGAPPDGKAIDVVLICASGDFERIVDHPEGIIKATTPRFLVLGHWENFFGAQTDICRTQTVSAIPRFDMDQFMRNASRAMKDARVPGKPILPCPTASVFHFPVDKANDAAVHEALKRPRASYECGR